MRSEGIETVVALSGGVGGAKLVLGLSRILGPGQLLAVANTGDDFEHFGLHISPDVDTLTYTLAGIDNPETGWGRRDETWHFMDALRELGGETWFRLGDRDLAIHVERTHRMRHGETLSAVTTGITRRLGIESRVIPMTDDLVQTRVVTRTGALDFQEYFVHRQCVPEVSGFEFQGADRATFHPAIVAALNSPRLRAVVICPSNPFISIDPILAVRGARQAIAATRAPVIAIAPIIGGRAVKGPAAKMMRELGLPAEAGAVAERYGTILDGYVVDKSDDPSAHDLDVPTLRTDILMRTLDDRERLARVVLEFADSLAALSASRRATRVTS